MLLFALESAACPLGPGIGGWIGGLGRVDELSGAGGVGAELTVAGPVAMTLPIFKKLNLDTGKLIFYKLLP